MDWDLVITIIVCLVIAAVAWRIFVAGRTRNPGPSVSDVRLGRTQLDEGDDGTPPSAPDER